MMCARTWVKRAGLCIVVAALTLLSAKTISAAADDAAPVRALPPTAAWMENFARDILPFWQEPAALGMPVGSFPTFRCNDGSVFNPQMPCPELKSAPEWISGGLGRQYIRMLSRQIYFYSVAFHLTGDPQYLTLAHAGVQYVIEHAFDRTTGNIASYFENGSGRAEFFDRTSQDLAYDLVGLSFYYYLTRDPAVLDPLVRTEQYIRQTYFDPKLGLYKLALQGPDAGRLDLVGQLDQANAYMLLAAPLLPPPYRDKWRDELAQIAKAMREHFWDRASGFFIGTLTPPAGQPNRCIFDRVDTDFGHTIKAYWMLSFIARLTHDTGLDTFARTNAPRILQRAFLPASGSWGMQPTCDAKAGGGINRNSKWWIAAELDQAALSFGLLNHTLLRPIPATFDFWQKHMVDHRYGEVWDEISFPDFTPLLPKTHLWKNGFHTAERTLVGTLMTSALRGEPVTLYYAFPNCRLPPDIRPYYYDGTVTAHAESPQQGISGFCRMQVTFANVR